MNNLLLFMCGMIVALIAGFGVIVYSMTPPENKRLRKPEPDIDLGSAIIGSESPIFAKQLESDSLEIPSVS